MRPFIFLSHQTICSSCRCSFVLTFSSLKQIAVVQIEVLAAQPRVDVFDEHEERDNMLPPSEELPQQYIRRVHHEKRVRARLRLRFRVRVSWLWRNTGLPDHTLLLTMYARVNHQVYAESISSLRSICSNFRCLDADHFFL